MAHDVVIRGGQVIDGTGAAARRADVAIDGDRIVEVGQVAGVGRREIDAGDRLVTPGFVDIHTHLDAQIGWDPLCSSSCWHGITSIAIGNCGVTFAPVRESDRDTLAEMMESVEDIPADAIRSGLPWSWETYGGYLDWIDTIRPALNIGGMVGHCAVRVHAMGDRAADEDAIPTDDELAAMVALVTEAMDAGALGFSTSRTRRHHIPDGRLVPGTWAHERELIAIAEVLGRAGRGTFGAAPRFDGDGPGDDRVRSEVAVMAAMSRAAGRPFTFNLTNTRAEPNLWRLAIEEVEAANAAGAQLRPQTTSKGIGVIFGLCHATPFDRHLSWAALRALPLNAKLAQLRDPEVRARLVEEAGEGRGPDAAGYEEFFVLTPAGGASYAPDPERSLTALARKRGVSAAEAFIEISLETDGAMVLNWPVLNQDFEAIAEMVTTPVMAMGLADAGAHVGQIMDASQPTWFLTYWVRERGLMPLEEAIRRMTSDTAGLFGIRDRGVVAPGAFADLNVFALDELELPLPTYERDLPGGAGRYTQRGKGYDYTLVNGQVAFEAGEHTGVWAGRTLRSTD